MDDTELLREYAEKGSEPAFAQLVEQHLDLVYSAALRRFSRDHHRAEEVTQMVFTDLARKATRLKNHPLLAGWLHRSTRWAAAGLRRAEQRCIANEQAAAIECDARTTEPSTDWTQLAPLLDEALDVLNERDRDVVLLRFFKNQPFAEIGTKLGLSENAARMRVERALGKLHALLAKRGITSTAAALMLALAQNAVSAAPAGLATTVSASALGSAAGGSTVLALLFMTKLQIALAGAVAVALAIGLTLQLEKNRHLREQLAGLQTEVVTAQSATTKAQNQLAEKEAALKQADVALAAQTPPLTPEQQERVRLDTIIRKGELDTEYAPLFRRLKLASEPLDKLKALIVERNQAIYDAVKLAKSQGVEPASPSEERAIGQSTTVEVDQRIATLLGENLYNQFQEYISLQPYNMWAQSMAGLDSGLSQTDFEKTVSPEFDERCNQLAQLLAKHAPRFLDESYRANGWPVDLPAELKEALATILPEKSMQRLEENESLNATRRRMYEIAREAALQGKVKLSKNSARDYPASSDNYNPSAK